MRANFGSIRTIRKNILPQMRSLDFRFAAKGGVGEALGDHGVEVLAG